MSSFSISLGNEDVGHFQCKLPDAEGNQCECCFTGRFGTKQPRMTKHTMEKKHTCKQWLRMKDRDSFRMGNAGKYALPERVEDGLAENEIWQEIAVRDPKVSPIANTRE